jgi:Uma2 family endonuclease
MQLPIVDAPLPLRIRLSRPMTEDELLRFCAVNDVLWVEREVNGELSVKPIGGCRVSSVNLAVGRELSRWAEKDGRGETFANAGFTLPDGSMRGAHTAWMLKERWESLTRQEQVGFAPRCPDFVVEIVSPFDTLEEMQAKMEQWIANGAQVGWLIDLDRAVVEIYQPGRAVEVLERPEKVVGDEPVAGFELVMARVWE